MKALVALLAAAVLAGCAAIPPERMPITTEQREFTYEFSAPSRSKDQIFKDVRNYFALAYRDTNKIGRVEDSVDGTIIAKAISPWRLTTDSGLIPSIPCGSNYNIIFVARDGKAKLQLVLLDGAVPPCGWSLPPKRDYPQVLREFESIRAGVADAIAGDSAIDRLKKF